VTLSAEQETADMLFILTDSQAALHMAVNLSNAAPPRSGIEKDLKVALLKRNTAIAWFRRPIGIPGEVKAGHPAAFESLLGGAAESPQTATEEGVRSTSKAIRREDRVAKGFGLRRSD